MKLIYLTLFILLSGCGEDNSYTPTTTPTVTSTLYEQNTVAQNNEAAVLYESCQPCHGVNGEKNALGKSRIIANFTQKEIVEAIDGYKNSTRDLYGMGGLMTGQVDTLSSYETIILAGYISSL